MRILYVIHQFFPDYQAGTETLARNVASKIISYGHEVAFFTGFPVSMNSKENMALDHYIFENMNVWRFYQCYRSTEDQPNIVEQEYDNQVSAKYFRAVLESFEADIVHVFNFQRVSASILRECRCLGVPVVFTPTDFWFMCPTIQLLLDNGEACCGPNSDYSNCLKHLCSVRSPPQIKKAISFIPDMCFSLPLKMSQWTSEDTRSSLALVRALSLRGTFLQNNLRQVDKILVPSRVMRNKLDSFLGSDENFLEMPYGIDFPKGVQHTHSQRLRVGFIGTLYKHKGAHILTEAVCSLPQDLGLDAFIYGDLEQFPEYAKQIKKHAELDCRVFLMGTFPSEKIHMVFSKLDVLVIPSLWHENTPLIGYAAQKYACPIVSSRIEGMQDMILDGVNGLFFTPGSVEELADILKRLSENSVELKRLSERARPPASASTYAEKLGDIYDSLLKG